MGPVWRLWGVMFGRTVFIYFFALLFVRIMGKRELASLSIFDFIIAVALGDIIGGPMVDARIPLDHVLLAVVTIVLLEIGTSWVTLKNERVRALIDGRPTIIVENGRIIRRNMAAIRYNLSDLLGKLREKGIAVISDVDYAIVEASGELSVVLKPEAQVPARRDLGIKVPAGGIPTVVIKDGRVMGHNLEHTGRTVSWLLEQLKAQGISGQEAVVLATLDSGGTLFIDQNEPAAPVLHGHQIE